MAFFVFFKMGKAPFSRALREIKQLLWYICPVIDHRGRQNVVRTSVTYSAIALCSTFFFLPRLDVICDLLLEGARQHGFYLFCIITKQSTTDNFEIFQRKPASAHFGEHEKSHLLLSVVYTK